VSMDRRYSYSNQSPILAYSTSGKQLSGPRAKVAPQSVKCCYILKRRNRIWKVSMSQYFFSDLSVFSC